MLSPSRQCQNSDELWDAQLVSENRASESEINITGQNKIVSCGTSNAKTLASMTALKK